MGVNKVEVNDETLIDLTSDSVTPETLAKGVTAHDASGERIVGTLDATSDTTVGTWVFNEEVFCDQGAWYYFKFRSAGKTYDGMYLDIDYIEYFTGDYSSNDYQSIAAYDAYNGGWQREEYKTVDIIEEPTQDDYSPWLKEHAKKQVDEDDSSNLEMPIIRFANFQDTEGDLCISETNPYKFTVEILGGGALKEGDLLQICVRRKYTNSKASKWKLRWVAQRTIEAEDIGKRFLSIEVTLENQEKQGYWLFRNDRNRKVDTYSGESIDSLSYMYFRIKRVTKYGNDGKECDAIFSNIEKVAKTYCYGEGRLIIK